MKIEEALEKEITRGNCETCGRRDGDFCDVTEEKIGSGDEYCELKPIAPQDNWEEEIESFIQKWTFEEYGKRYLGCIGSDKIRYEGFLIDVSRLLKSQKEENDREWREKIWRIIPDDSNDTWHNVRKEIIKKLSNLLK